MTPQEALKVRIAELKVLRLQKSLLLKKIEIENQLKLNKSNLIKDKYAIYKKHAGKIILFILILSFLIFTKEFKVGAVYLASLTDSTAITYTVKGIVWFLPDSFILTN